MRRVLATACVAAAALAAAGGSAWLLAEDGDATERPELQKLLDQLVAGPARAAPGVTAYVSGPQGIWVGAAGSADLRTGERMQPDARMRLESVSKLWTATLVLALAERGVLRLDDTAEQHLPGLLPAGDRITVRQLLNHTSGLLNNDDIAADVRGYLRQVADPELRAELDATRRSFEADPELEIPSEQVVRLAAALPLLSEPGTAYHYSNVGYNVVGLILEQTTGRRLAELFDEHIIDPLGLESAAYDPRARITGPHPRAYALAADGTTVDTTRRVEDLGANGGIVSDARDEAIFLAALMRGEIVRPASVRAIKTPSELQPYGLGTAVEPSGCAGIAYTHNGGGSGFSTSVYVSGDGSRVAVVLANGRTDDGHGDALVEETALRLFCAA